MFLLNKFFQKKDSNLSTRTHEDKDVEIIDSESAGLLHQAQLPIDPENQNTYEAISRSDHQEKSPPTSQDKVETVSHDIFDTLRLSVPIFVSMVSWVGMRTTDTALLGHVSAEALSASALSDLWTMCTGVLLQANVLSILVGQAVGAGNPKLGGTYLQISWVVLAFISVFVIVTWNVTEQVWLLLGESGKISSDAGYYARILSLAIPGTVVFGQLRQYFSAQRIMNPEVISSLFALILNLIFGLMFVLGLFFPNFDGYGFAACPVVTAAVQYLQIIFFVTIFIGVQKLHKPCWGGWSWEEITAARVVTFCKLYFPAAMSSASDFWRVAVIGAIAAKLGEVEVGIFNTSYRIMWICLIMVSSMSSAASIKMSMRLGKGHHILARQAGYVGIGLAFLFLVVVSLYAVYNNRLLGGIFTQDKEFLNLFEEARLPFSATLFLMCWSVALERIPYAMGRTSDVFWMGFFASWLAQVPAVYLFTRYWRQDLVGLYTGMAVGYLTLSFLYGLIIVTSNWKEQADIAQERAEANPSGKK